MKNVKSQFDSASQEGREIGGLAAGESDHFLSLMGHMYRAEVGRSTSWRSRLDRTTNWTVVLTASLITWGFASHERPHYVILVGMVMMILFLVIEARRYRVYDVWRSRVRLLEENVLANALHPDGVVHQEWREMLSEDLHEPSLKTPMSEALARRLRRIYLPVLLVLLVAWVVRLTVFAAGDVSVIDAARIARIPGHTVLVAVVVLYGTAFLLAFWPMRRQAKGELHEDEEAAEDWKHHDCS